MLNDADRYILAGRLKNYLGKLEDSVALFGEGIERFPDDARLYRHRGHRFITLRRFDEAVRDLAKAAELVEGTPDEHEWFQPQTERDLIDLVLGRELPPQRLPVTPETIEATKGDYKSTLHVSIQYHLAIAHYLRAEFADALRAFREADELSVDDDMRVASADWMYMTLRRLGDTEAAEAVIAPFDVDAVNVNPQEDFYLQRLRMYKGLLDPETLLARHADDPLAFATQGYGVGNWCLYENRPERAREIFEDVVGRGAPHAFGYIAAEADLARLVAVPS